MCDSETDVLISIDWSSHVTAGVTLSPVVAAGFLLFWM
jgi:hypothetical protein